MPETLKLNPPPPRAPGVYVLVLRLSGPVSVGARVFRGDVPPGTYTYIGSAGGPGGLRARIARHLRRRKRLWWHVDWLTTSPNAKVAAVAYCASQAYGTSVEASAAECLESRGYKPVRGFGSTDDPHSKSHLHRAPHPDLDAVISDSLECLARAAGGGSCSAITIP